MLAELEKVLDRLNRDRHTALKESWRHRTRVVTRQTLIKGAARFCPRKHTKWSNCPARVSLAGFLSSSHATSIAGSAIKMFWSPLTGTTTFSGIFKELATLTRTNVCALKHLGGVCWISTKSLEWRRAGATERQDEKCPLIVRDRKPLFAQDHLIVGASSVDPELRILAKALCLMVVLKMGGSHELVEKI